MKKLFAALVICFSLTACDAQAQEAQSAFTLPQLTYGYNELEPSIDEATMRVHHTKHHQAYIDKLNAEVEKNKALQGKSLDDIIAHVSKYNDAVRNNAGGHWNHAFFWQVMAPENKTGKISPELQKAIDQSFGSTDKFKAEFEKAGTDRFGSGWVWLIMDKKGKLKVTSTGNQDNPLMDDAQVKGTPILGNDVWEHAYYLKYQNNRGNYLKSWWQVVNWGKVSENYAAARN